MRSLADSLRALERSLKNFKLRLLLYGVFLGFVRVLQVGFGSGHVRVEGFRVSGGGAWGFGLGRGSRFGGFRRFRV